MFRGKTTRVNVVPPGKALAARVAHVILPALVHFRHVTPHLVSGGEKFAAKLK
jgi:hypothetical protein